MNAVALARRLAGLALTVERDRPTAAHWVAAMALAAEAEPVPGHTREVAFVAGRARVHLHPLSR
ncbi:hypothetical protein [Methylobacterium gossipiicola]|uniref:Uncharacterized protein n=1 Tax=Methylobacterium gossipiicola TaxID=582675 RepID=A0A1I2TK24_9HYPH|nr:hypothetical protein [Methylobacterium gossipiicola]SFG65163.1 hypothetical protein SAMN05192565_107162 [Methylobacterium gossipiicola]